MMRVSDDEIDLEAEEGSSDSGYGDDDWGWHDYDNHSQGISDIETTDDGCKDPRKYWIEIVRARMYSVVEEWRHIVCSLETTHQEVRSRYVLNLTNDNTKPDFRSRALFGTSPKKIRRNIGALVPVK
jgi:hypothetical protein